uniref:Ig-like domain-containing protein n=1 Tax=Chelonoidis abingdonii TaxID=106734 RepID=A0A8C0HC08_CHEAB
VSHPQPQGCCLLCSSPHRPPLTISPLPSGTPMANVFTAQPLELGKPNTLICQVGNLFPPSVTVSWQRLGEPVSQGVNTTRYYPTEDLGFLLFSYLEFTPQEGDIYTCTITRPRDRFSTVAYWGEGAPRLSLVGFRSPCSQERRSGSQLQPRCL